MLRRITFFCLCFLAFTPFDTKALTDEQKVKIREHLATYRAECIKDFPVSKEDLASIRDKNIEANSDENTRCYVACMMKKIGIMDNNGTINKETALEKAKKVFGDSEDVQKIETYVHKCSEVNSETVSDGDKSCERAALALKCMKENVLQNGFEKYFS